MEILDRINTEFGGKYNFLRVQSVTYSTRSFSAQIVFLYPENITNFEDEQKIEVSDFVKKELALGCEVKIKFKRSYLDEPLIKKNLFEFLKSSYPSMFVYDDGDMIVISKNADNIEIKLSLMDVVYQYFTDNKVSEKILSHLNNDFIANFNVVLTKNDKNIDDKILEEHEKHVYDNLPKQKEVERYPVFEPELLVGQDITPMPEPIINQEDAKSSVILAGKISNFADKTYVSKKNKLKGIDEPSHYLTFTLTDYSGSIDAIYFAHKTTYKKVNVLKDDDRVLVVGDIRKDYDKKKLYIKSISFCVIDSSVTAKKEEKVEEDKKPIVKNVHIAEYRFVKPAPYILDRQENLFDVKPNYSDYVKTHTFVVFDCETTGLSCDYNEIIEIGAVKIENGLIKEQFQTFVCPENEIPDEITRLTTITNEMVKDAPNGEQAITDFYKFCEGCVLVGYNVSFDLGFIQNTAKKAKLYFSNESVDAMEVVRKKMYLSRYKLINVVDALGLKLKNAHRAIADAIATAEVFLKLNEIQ